MRSSVRPATSGANMLRTPVLRRGRVAAASFPTSLASRVSPSLAALRVPRWASVVPRAASTTTEEASVAVDDAEGPRKSTAYDFTGIEKKWQAYWAENKTFRTPEEVDTSKPKYYVLDMFPYPSGAGLHVGHPEGYTATDIMARYKRMTGHNVLHPMGWDAFGLPAEQYAIQTGTHPAVTTAKNIDRFREQLQSLGFSYDWDREISTTDPEYYRWTQWIFLQLLERGLAYQAEVPVNWCPALGTVLANEEVIDGLSERGDHPVIRMPMKQWMLKITAYGDRLLEDLDDLDWGDNIKEMQRNWIGRSEGADVRFALKDGAEGEELLVYTTRPDTLCGVTYMVVAPEHPLVERLAVGEAAEEVKAYVEAAARKSDRERTELQKVKTGVFTGSYAVNPATGEDVPIYVGDYVLGTYGSGAIMAVPGHDARDFEFAEAYGIPVRPVVAAADGSDVELPFTGEGVACNSEALGIDGMGTAEAKAAATAWVTEEGVGEKRVNFKLRDWLFARQRYWGEPFPVMYAEGSDVPIPVPDSDLPLTLPDTDNFKPSGSPESPLANVEDWVNTVDPNTGGPARRDTNTMPQWAGSCWYYLRYIDPKNGGYAVDPELEKYWMPVDLYVGGAEHAVLHLLYARFWHKVLYDIGVVNTKEPFQRLVSQGMILGETEYTAYQDADGNYTTEDAEGAKAVKIAADEVEKSGNGFVIKGDSGAPVTARAFKMSKSRGNVINPDDVVYEFGADSLRLYEMFMGPLTETKVWSTRSVEGVHRFLARMFRLVDAEDLDMEAEPTKKQLRDVHQCIKKVTEDTEGMRFNTAISAMMEFVNAANKWDNKPAAAIRPVVQLLSPYAPHLAEELWERLGGKESITYEPWPAYDEALLVEDEINLPVQVNGKMRGTVTVPKDISQDDAVAMAKAIGAVSAQIDGKDIKKIIWVPGRILNFIAK